MSDFGVARVTVQLDSRTIDRDVQRLLDRIARQVADVRVNADARTIPRTIESAVDAADTQITVTGDARELTGEVEGAVDAADTEVIVTGEATELTGDVEGAIDAADTQVVVTGEATELTGDVEGAIDAADTEVTVTGEASDVTGSITAATQAADTHVAIEADDGGSLGLLSDNADALALSLGTSRLSALSLGNVLRGGIIAGAALQLYQAAQAASALEESTNKATVVFASGAELVQDFSDTAATSVGLSSQAALEATGTFGNLFTSLGLTKSAAAAMSPDVVQLAADLASFNNLNVQDTLEKIRSGLVGEIEPLRTIGISFNAAQVEAKGMELGLETLNGQLTEGAKVQARWALIQEQSTNAAGDFARTSEGLANQQRILTAEYQNAVVQIGQGLLPLLLEMVGAARNAIPAFTEFAQSGLGALVELLTALLPLLGTATDLLVALTPVVEVLADVIGAVPAPLLQMAGAFLLLSRVMPPVVGLFPKLVSALGGFGFAAGLNVQSMGVLRGGLTTVKDGFSALLGSIGPATVLLGGAAAAFTAWSGEQQKAAAANQAATAQINTFSAAITDSQPVVQSYTDALREMVLANEELALATEFGGGTITNLGTFLRQAGVTVEDFSGIVARGQGAVNTFADRLDDGSIKGQLLSESVRGLADQMQQGAETSINAGVSTDRWSDAAARAAVRSNTARDGTKNYAAALDELNAKFPAVSGAQGAVAGSTERTTSAFWAAGDALVRLQAVSPQVAGALQAMLLPGGNARQEFSNLAVAAGQAKLSEEDLQLISDSLGVEMSELGPALDVANAALARIRDTALQSTPGLSGVSGAIAQVFPDLAQEQALTLGQVEAGLQKILEDTAAFNDNMALIIRVAPQLTELAAQSPQIAAAIAGAYKDGGAQALAELQLLNAGVQLETQEAARIIDENGNVIVANSGTVGKEATDAFAGAYAPQTPAATATEQARRNILAQKDPMHAAGSEVGTAGRTGYSEGLNPVGQDAATDMAAARNAIVASKDPHSTAGKDTAGAAQSAYNTALTPVDENARALMAAARGRIAAEEGPQRESARRTARAAQSAYKTALTPVDENARALMAAAHDRISGALGGHQSAARRTADAARNAYSAAMRPVPEDTRQHLSTARQRIDGARGGFSTSGSGVGRAVRDGVRTGMDQGNFDDKVRSWKSKIESAAKSIFNIGSPARTMIPIGARIAEGFAEGIGSREAYLRAIIKNIGLTIGNLFGGIGFSGKGVGGGALSGLEDSFEAIVRQILALGGGRIYLNSGYRSSSQQAVLYYNYIHGIGGQALAAPPGRSKHERGLAVDWGGDVGLYTRLSKQFGLVAPVPGEHWHWQPVWAGQTRSYYEQGAWKVLRDEFAGLHRGEMVVPAQPAEAIRTAVTGTRRGRGGGVVIEQMIVTVPPDTADPFGFGRRVRKGFESTLAGRRVMTDARLAG